MKKFLFLYLSLILVACTETVSDAKQEATQPDIFPDYVGVTIPQNIAPLNFCMLDRSALLVDAVITDRHGNELHGQGDETTDFDLDEWHELLSQNVGDSLQVLVSAKYADGWHTYQPFSLFVSPDTIDYGVVYRRIEPGYEVYSKMGIYERSLSSFKETALIENTQFSGCVNCHSFNRCDPTDMSLHIRGSHGATLLRIGGNMEAYNTATPQTLGSCVYPAWHPGGRYIAYSTNATRQVFHVCDSNRIEVYDEDSDVLLYDTQTNELIKHPLLACDSLLETFPSFSADGRTLYFVAAKKIEIDATTTSRIEDLRYNLCSIAFDPATGSFGDKIDTLLNAEALGRSATMPRPSYDGRFMLLTMADYGQFPIWHHEADLYLVPISDLKDLKDFKDFNDINDLNDPNDLNAPKALNRYRLPRANSADTESFHNWSSNSRWIVFSSRRDDGLFTRLYFSHIDSDGNDTKPFLLPQANPRRYYDELFMSYNVPDFVVAPVNFNDAKAVKLINSDHRTQMKVR